MPAIKAREKSEDVRNLIGFSDYQWRQFMKFTKDEAERLIRNEEGVSTWIDVDDIGKDKVLNYVNKELDKKKIPHITLEVLRWRMPKAMGELRKLNATSSRAESSQQQSQLQASDDPATHKRTEYYDPAREDTGSGDGLGTS
ncbi:hypothetical protein BCR34DRAFT_587252 [Clohesyomyces aquaticus]|uniref:Uncharacterized protein n=1 Tax=Clohesyomyces aquaticus TaxID=1231657 RepID=A0A1Y1ZQD8_9PLEO|nr:hypothetical protein BCR34DRAFT_587252 [Clohesyomyces aquaticus]